MSEAHGPTAAIVDYGMGNLFSVKQACERAGLRALLTSAPDAVKAADAVILPGVGAFGDAMAALERQGLVGALKETAEAGKPLMGICLGMQLLMSSSDEFGRHQGLDLIAGDVVRFTAPREAGASFKVPHVGWNRVFPGPVASWRASALAGLTEGAFMYFVHSYYARPENPNVVLALSRYGHIEFCSSLRQRNIFACQFHPERSGPAGLQIYRTFAAQVQNPGACDA